MIEASRQTAIDRPVYYFCRMLPAYRIAVLERLHDRIGRRLIVCYGQTPVGDSTLIGDIEATFHRVQLKNYWWRGESLHAQPFAGVFRQYGPPEVVIAEESPRSLTLPLLLRSAKRRGAGRILWGMFYSTMKPPRSSLHPLRRYRIWMAQRVDACLCYSNRSRQELAPYVDTDRLFVAQNTVDTTTLFALRERLEEEGRSAVRSRLGLPDHLVLVFVGRLVPDKGTDELLTLFESLVQQQDATLVVIGDGPERAPMEARAERAGISGHVQFLGSIPEFERSAAHIFASDVMVIPGCVGLAVNHAFCLGVPVLTQEPPGNAPFHGPEIESIIQGINGLIVPRTPGQLLEGMRRIVGNRSSFSANAFEYAKDNLSIDRLLDAMVDAIEYAKKENRS